MNMIKVIIFDMDGVILNSEKIKAKAWKILLEEHGIQNGDTWHIPWIGRSTRSICEEAVELFSLPIDIDSFVKRRREISAAMVEKTEPFEGTIHFLKSIPQNFVLAVASSTDKEIIEKELKLIGVFDMFNVVVSGENDVQNNKPAPDIYNLVASRLNVNPFDCVVIEDSASGVHAAKSAGMKCIAYQNEYTKFQDLSKADLIIDDFLELTIEKIEQL